MAAPAVVRSSGPPLCPSFAEVCSFLERYGPALDLPEMTFPQLERYLRDTTAVSKPLVDLHVKLLRKLGKSVTTDRWEKYLAKVCQELNSTWAWELEQKGYQDMSMECKSSILKYLCECQFDDNLKFKMMINDEDPEKMRLQPIGRDRQGLLYWMQLDQEQNIRLYTEEQDDLDGSTWRCIVRNRNDLAEALELLKTQVEPNQNQEQNLTESRSTSPAERGDEANEINNAKSTRTTEKTDHIKTDPEIEKKPMKQEMKQEPMIKQENTENEVKEEKTDNKTSVFDNRVSTITAIKPEPRDVAKNAVSVVTASCVSSTKPNVNEEAERAAVRSNQQAKIPLKKRNLKLADSFHTNHLNSNSSSIIVCNPSVIQSKDAHGREGNFLNSAAPACGPAAPQHQLLNSAGPELTNGRASLFQPYKEGQNGVIGVIGHVGVIRSPSELHRTSGSERQEQNGPSLEPGRAVREDKEVSRQSVLVRKEPASSSFPLHEASESQTCKAPPPLKADKLPEETEKKVDSAGASSVCQATGETQKQEEEERSQEATEQTTEEESEKAKNAGRISRQQKDLEETRKDGLERDLKTEEPEKASSNLSSICTESRRCASPKKTEKHSKKEEEKGLNGGIPGQAKGKRSAGSGSEQERGGPLEEASSELQKEGIRLKIKIPPHRRNKLRGKRGKGQEKDVQKEQEEGRLLRRSARICRSSSLPTCRPSSKVTEIQRKKPPRKQPLPARARDEEEAEEEEEEEQISASKENRKLVGEVRKLRGKRRHRRPRWSNVRTKRRKPNEEEEGRGQKEDGEERSDSEEESCKSTEIPSEDCCSHCGLPNHPELILLCDSCDSGYHTACLRPPVMLIPDGEWFCPPCQHKLLCEKLEEQLQNLDSALKKRERAERRRERLVYVGISVENIIPEEDKEEEEKTTKKKDCKRSKNLGRRSTRTRKHISYRFDDFDDAIDEAIEEDFGDLCGGAGKDITSILSEDVERPIRSQTRAARSRRRRRLNDLESDSTAAESEDEFMLSNSSEEEECGASGPDDDEEEDEEDMGSDGGSWDKGTKPRKALKGVPRQKPGRGRRRGRKRQWRRSEEESEEDIDSDQYSDMSDSDQKRRGLRRGQHQQVNYRETSESSDSSRASAEEKKSKARTRKEALSSDYSDSFPSSRESEEEDYEEEDEDRRPIGRRREKEEFRKSRTIEKRRRYKHHEERGQRLRRRHLEKEPVKDRRRRLTKDEEEEDLEKMGRGKRREILSQQRRRRLAQMLKKRRPSTDEEEESSEEESESSSEEDRPIRKRLNRIDSDDEEDEEEEEDVRRKTKKPSGGERTSDDKNDSDSQERGRGQSPSANEHQTSRGLQKPGSGSSSTPRDGSASDRQSRHNGPWHPEEEEEEEEEGQTDSINSVQNSPPS
ncbi:remodeling and spacing factor 1 isoform X1 [Oryzias melastigma]|uniref:remodeling and spacing factor 1 isoform X1 n=1 Tax=Oryzias melastigma TaxID=30732 RepID=UPI000CF7D898|nr:remodeling and spacing factor 1 isoform X1 [Oryzias melastigma]